MEIKEVASSIYRSIRIRRTGTGEQKPGTRCRGRFAACLTRALGPCKSREKSMAASNRPEVLLRDNGDNARRWQGRSFICRFEKSFANGYHPPFSIPPFFDALRHRSLSPFSSPFPSLLPFFFFFSLLSPSVRFEDASRNAPHHRTNVPEKFPGLSLIFHAAARCSDIDFLAIFVQPPPCGPYSKFRMKSDGKRS